MAVRTFGWWWVNNGPGGWSGGQCYDVDSTDSFQAWGPGGTDVRTDYAVEQTWNWLLQNSGVIYPTHYNSGFPDDYCGEAHPDPDLDLYAGSTMSQYGSQQCGLDGRTWAETANVYYFDNPLNPPAYRGDHTYGEWHDALGWRYTLTTPFTPVSISGNIWKYRTSNNCGPPAVSYGYGNPGDMKVIGDWNGDGAFTQGVVRMQGGQIWWYLSDVLWSGTANIQFTYGQYGDIPVGGDWNNDGQWTAGVFRGNREWLLSNYFPPLNGVADMRVVFGAGLDTPLPGKWRSLSSQPVVVGVARFDAAGTIRFIEAYSNSDWRVYRNFTYGLHTDRPLVGDWKTGDDTHYGPGVVRDETILDCGSANQGWHLRYTNDGGVGNLSFKYDIIRP